MQIHYPNFKCEYVNVPADDRRRATRSFEHSENV